MAHPKTSDPATIAAGLTAAQARVLLSCVRHTSMEDRLTAVNPQRVAAYYYAGAAEKRVAARLTALGLMKGERYANSGADVLPTPLGRAVAECLEVSR